MNSKPSTPGTGSIEPMASPARATPLAGDGLLGSIFDSLPAAAAPKRPPPAAAGTVAVLRLAVIGLKPVERQLLEGLVKVSQRRTPRLEIMDEMHDRQADVVMVDTRDAAAMAWAGERPWLRGRAVIWIDGTEAGPGHTLLPRPVQWPILPMVLARALESAPAARGAAMPAPSSYPAAPGAGEFGRPLQILVVDDNKAVRVHLRSVLEPFGYVVTEAESVRVALERIGQRGFDCVLMDVVMPEADGYEGCRQIKSRWRGADAVPVIMLTSKGSPFDRIRGKMAGCDAYLTKPVDPRHLQEVLAQQVAALPSRASAPELPVDLVLEPDQPPGLLQQYSHTRPAPPEQV